MSLQYVVFIGLIVISNAGIISFARKQDSNELLNAWASDISDLLGLVEKTCHMIGMEYMAQKKRSGGAEPMETKE